MKFIRIEKTIYVTSPEELTTEQRAVMTFFTTYEDSYRRLCQPTGHWSLDVLTTAEDREELAREQACSYAILTYESTARDALQHNPREWGVYVNGMPDADLTAMEAAFGGLGDCMLVRYGSEDTLQPVLGWSA